jgi:MFS transporter, putative metabolite:H+ symporter
VTPYQRRLLIFLSVATFFEGYDFLALSQILPELRADFGISKFGAGLLFAFVNFGTVVAYLLVRKADSWGRKKVLTITIVGYTVFTFLTGMSWDVWSFAVFQFIARMFLIGEWVTAMVYAAEEYPADRRGMVIGVLQGFSTLGALVCAGVVPLLMTTNYGWRSVYLVGILPLVMLAFARRNLRETTRFAERELVPAGSLLDTIKGPYGTRILKLAAIWFLTYGCTQVAVSFWKEFVVTDRGWTDADVARALLLAAVGSLPFVFGAGKLLDVIGRRKGAVFIFIATSIGVFGAYTLESTWGLTLSLGAAMFGVTAVLPVLNAYTTELFPTEIRSDAFAWANNLLGRFGYVLSPIAIGYFAETYGWGAAIRPTAILPLMALALILLWLPETNSMELEESSKL